MPSSNPHRLYISQHLTPANASVHRAESFEVMSPESTNALRVPRLLPIFKSTARRGAVWIGVQPWRFIFLLGFFFLLTAWAGTRAVVAGIEKTWTGAALSAASHENRAQRDRAEVSPAETDAPLARPQGIPANGSDKVVEASSARTP